MRRLWKPPEGAALIFNCQMGRGRTSTGMIIASLLHLRRRVKSVAMPAEPQGDLCLWLAATAVESCACAHLQRHEQLSRNTVLLMVHTSLSPVRNAQHLLNTGKPSFHAKAMAVRQLLHNQYKTASANVDMVLISDTQKLFVEAG